MHCKSKPLYTLLMQNHTLHWLAHPGVKHIAFYSGGKGWTKHSYSGPGIIWCQQSALRSTGQWTTHCLEPWQDAYLGSASQALHRSGNNRAITTTNIHIAAWITAHKSFEKDDVNHEQNKCMYIHKSFEKDDVNHEKNKCTCTCTRGNCKSLNT